MCPLINKSYDDYLVLPNKPKVIYGGGVSFINKEITKHSLSKYLSIYQVPRRSPALANNNYQNMSIFKVKVKLEYIHKHLVKRITPR